MQAGESRIFETSYRSLVKYSQQAMREAQPELEFVEKVDGETYMIIGNEAGFSFQWGRNG